MAIIKIKIGKKVHNVDTEELLVIGDLNEDMAMVAAQMAFYSSLNAAAEEDKILMDSYYRRWRAKKTQQIQRKDSKLAEWKVKALIEEDAQFDVMKKALALATKQALITRGIYESLRTKAQMLQSKGAMQRAELDSTNMRTPKKTSGPNEKEKRKKMRKVLDKDRKKK